MPRAAMTLASLAYLLYFLFALVRDLSSCVQW
jgi:hypothetical protein